MPDVNYSNDTRERIIYFLRQNQTATVPRLSKLWGLTCRDIRYHLGKLIQDGLVVQVEEKIKANRQRGRPMITYRLNPGAEENNYTKLCHLLLVSLIGNQVAPTSNEGLNELARIFVRGSNLQPGVTSNHYNQAIKFLNSQAYRSRWEATSAGPQIFFLNCPYASLLEEHPELCQLDRMILEQLFGSAVVQTERINITKRQPGACIFRITFSAKQKVES